MTPIEAYRDLLVQPTFYALVGTAAMKSVVDTYAAADGISDDLQDFLDRWEEAVGEVLDELGIVE